LLSVEVEAIRIHDIQGFCLQDEPGIRTTSFLQRGDRREPFSRVVKPTRPAEPAGGFGVGTDSSHSGSGEVYLVFWCFEDWNTKIRWIRIMVGE